MKSLKLDKQLDQFQNCSIIIEGINTTNWGRDHILLQDLVAFKFYKKFPKKGVAFINLLCYNNFCPLRKGLETAEQCDFENSFKKLFKKL